MPCGFGIYRKSDDAIYGYKDTFPSIESIVDRADQIDPDDVEAHVCDFVRDAFGRTSTGVRYWEDDRAAHYFRGGFCGDAIVAKATRELIRPKKPKTPKAKKTSKSFPYYPYPALWHVPPGVFADKLRKAFTSRGLLFRLESAKNSEMNGAATVTIVFTIGDPRFSERLVAFTGTVVAERNKPDHEEIAAIVLDAYAWLVHKQMKVALTKED